MGKQFSLAPYFRAHFEGTDVICDVYPPGRRFKLGDMKLLAFLTRLDIARTADEIAELACETLKIGSIEACDLVVTLTSAGVLLDEDIARIAQPLVDEWAESGWLDALFLHISTRNLSFDDEEMDSKQLKSALRRMLLDAPPPSQFIEREGHAFPLPNPAPLPEESLVSTIERRRSGGPWRDHPLSISELSALLVHANSHSRQLRLLVEANIESNPEMLTQSAFCALETYLVVNEVEGLQAGLYHFDLRRLRLISLGTGNYAPVLQRLCIGQERISTARCALLLSIRWERYSHRYRHSRAFRTLMIDLAESAHNYILIATLLGLGNFITPAVDEVIASEIIGEDPFVESVFYVVGVG